MYMRPSATLVLAPPACVHRMFCSKIAVWNGEITILLSSSWPFETANGYDLKWESMKNIAGSEVEGR